MLTEQQRIAKLEDDMIDMKIRMGITEGDVSAIKAALGNINKNLHKVLWTVIGSSASLGVGIIVALVTFFLNKK